MKQMIWIISAVGVLALLFAGDLFYRVKCADEGNERMKELALAIRQGAGAFLRAEYKILAFFVLGLFFFIGKGIGDWIRAGVFVLGAFCSVLAGYIGMAAATKANVRTTNAAWEKGAEAALMIAFQGGAVMGMCVVGLGLLGCTLIYGVTGNEGILSSFGLGASSIALFARVGGGIYTKAADIGADLVGKIEAGIPEDDPRNPAVIADNVGDNVGDVAGMGADLFESYVGSLVSAITLGAMNYQETGVIFPLFISAAGIIAAMIGSFFVRDGRNPHRALKAGTYISEIIVMVATVILSWHYFGNLHAAMAVGAGLLTGVLIGFFTEVYTSYRYRHVKRIAVQAEAGPATAIISGIAVGMKSTCAPILFICAGIFIAYHYFGLYGIALASVGMLSTTGMTVAVDAYGPIADNAGGIAEMAGLDHSVRKITDQLDSVGNTTAAIGKGFAIGSAALTALALFVSYAQAAGLTAIDVMDPLVIIGLLTGSMLPFLFSALTIDSVSKAAYQMIEEVRRQFRVRPGIMRGTERPDYRCCVSISTTAALKEMLVPGMMAVIAPLAMGLLLGTAALGGMLTGALVTGVCMAIFMSNSGGAWDNAKKYIEQGTLGGKGSIAHKAAVAGDTVGDPFKDTSGPSLNILIKLMTVISLVFAPVLMELGGMLLK